MDLVKLKSSRVLPLETMLCLKKKKRLSLNPGFGKKKKNPGFGLSIAVRQMGLFLWDRNHTQPDGASGWQC